MKTIFISIRVKFTARLLFRSGLDINLRHLINHECHLWYQNIPSFFLRQPRFNIPNTYQAQQLL